MLRAVLRWFSLAPHLDLAACKRLVSKVLKLAASPAQQVRRAVIDATSVLAKPQIIWAAFAEGHAELQPSDKPSLLKAECKVLQVTKHASLQPTSSNPSDTCKLPVCNMSK